MTLALPDIRTPRLWLRPLLSNAEGSDDLEWYHKVWSNDLATQWSYHGPCRTTDDSRAWMAGILSSTEPGSKPVVSYAALYPVDFGGIDDSSEWAIAGILTMLPTNSTMTEDGHMSNQTPEDGSFKAMELGYLLHPQIWGRGYATESLQGLLKAYREDLLPQMPHLPRELCANVHKMNQASLRVAQKLGMQAVGEFDSEGDLPLVGGKQSYTVVYHKLQL